MAVQNDAYPQELKDAEIELIGKRRKGDNPDFEKRPIVGLALSGGGIRSATFSLGVFQALSGFGLLGEIDYLSTVSGGGYFGSFLGGLFARKEIQDAEAVQNVLLEKPASEQRAGWAAKVMPWLRENGRYLAPNGAGDALLGAASVIRNWIAIQIVMATLVIAILLFAQIVRVAIESLVARAVFYEAALSINLPWGKHLIWWSPYSIVAGFVFLVFVVPPAWSYWLVEKRGGTFGSWIKPIWGLRAVAVLSFLGFIVGLCTCQVIVWSISAVLFVEAVLTWLWKGRADAHAGISKPGADTMLTDEKIRNSLSRDLTAGLTAFGVVLAFVIVDSLGQTLYSVATSGDHDLKAWAIGFFGPIVAIAGVIQRLLAAAGAKTGGKRLGLPLSLLAGAGAVVVALAILVTLDFCAHSFAWGFTRPDSALVVQARPVKLIDAKQLSVKRDNATREVLVTPSAAEDTKVAEVPRGHRSPGLLWLAFGVSALFSFLFGRSWPFLNRSSQKTIYASRLIRAYLGASNSARFSRDDGAVTDVIGGDDFEQTGYWPLFERLKGATGNKPVAGSGNASVASSEAPAPDAKAQGATGSREESKPKSAPLHLVNVTINETLDARSQVEQHDRKGIGMAIGPAGISAGVTHHVVIDGSKDHLRIYPTEGFRMFDYKGNNYTGEMLTLGNWTSISGAAVSTGLGSRTSLGASFLLGFANARLGYWWDSGVDRKGGRGSVAGAWFNWMLPVQSFLLDEFLARFHGSARRWWYLTDGGHFENMGGYELIRRKIKMIVVVDAEEDPDYTFEGISNLVRKARIDFGAEIEFLDESRLERVDGSVRKYFGTLDQLRRGIWKKEPVHDPNPTHDEKVNLKGKRVSLRPSDENALSLAHAALAEVKYADDEKKGLLLYIKPTLTGDEPVDVRRYHSEHPSFPHESTAEQFFDEAQWESYRKLGEHIAELIFKPATGEAGKFLPYKLGG